MPWRDDEHAAFLEGLERFGKGSWLAISRFCVPTRNSTQIASHAQKYFLRQSQGVSRNSRFTKIERVRTEFEHVGHRRINVQHIMFCTTFLHNLVVYL